MVDESIGTLTGLWRYPVSSVGGESISGAFITKRGMQHDRSFAFFNQLTFEAVDPARKMWSGIANLQARLGHDEQPLVSLDGQQWLSIDDPGLNPFVSSYLGQAVGLYPYGSKIAGHVLAHRYKLAPIHLVSQQSLGAIKALLPQSQVHERRFRPNIVIDFNEGAHSSCPEYSLIGKVFRLGGVRLRGIKACGRCSFTTLQQPGLPEDRNILRTLISTFNKDFGIYCEVLEEGWLELGQLIHPLEVLRNKATVVIVGAGQAGATVARGLRKAGHMGSIKLIGDERHAPYERPPLSKQLSALNLGATLPSPVLTKEDAQELNIDLQLDSQVVRIDRKAQMIETQAGLVHAYDYLVLATGGTAKRIPSLNRGHGRTHVIRTLGDAHALQQAFGSARKVFIVGGGWLGLEVSSAARKAGAEVTLFVRQDRVCSKALPNEVADYLADYHRAQGVHIRLNCEPLLVERENKVDAQIGNHTECADLLVVAIGIHPNDYLARHAGLPCQDGVLTDVNGQTIDPQVFAVGDLSRQKWPGHVKGLRLESWQNAVEQANRAAHALLGLTPPPPPVPRFWSEQYELSIQIAGIPDVKAPLLSVDGPDSARLWIYRGFAIGINRPRDIHQFAQALSGSAPVQNTVESGPSHGPVRAGRVKRYIRDVINLGDGEMRALLLPDIGEVLIVRLAGQYYGIQDCCPHAKASLSEGFVEGQRIVCPLHFAEFDLISGQPFNAPAGCARAITYEVSTEPDGIVIWVPG